MISLSKLFRGSITVRMQHFRSDKSESPHCILYFNTSFLRIGMQNLPPFSSNSDFLVMIRRKISTYHFSWRSTGTWTFYHPRCHDLCSSEFQTSKLPSGSLFPLQTAFLNTPSKNWEKAVKQKNTVSTSSLK